jgi:anti-sigma factor RsiW
VTCESAKSLAGAYLDDELDASLSAQVREHFAACQSCAEAHAQQIAMRAGIREHAPYFRAPAGLEHRISLAVRHGGRPDIRPRRWLALAAGILVAIFAAWKVAQLRSPASLSDPIAQEVLSSHVRSLMATHLLDVPSSDQHTVKPWFNGKLDFSPDVKDFAAQGFPLAGGRLDYIEGRPVAALVYQRRQHVINLFTWPAAEDGRDQEFGGNGYRILHWTHARMAWWAISDLSIGELRRFEDLCKQ